MTYQELDKMLRYYDAILDTLECLEDDKFELIQDAYLNTFAAREKLRLQEIEYFRGHLERSFAS